MLDLNSLNNKIIIIKDKMKESLLDIINKENHLLNIKIITLTELKNNYYFKYNKQTIFYICNKCNVNSDLAMIYINNMYYINSDSDNDKISFLYNLKNELISNNLLVDNDLFRSFLNNKDIVLYDLKYVDKFYLNIFSELKKNNKVIEIDYDINNGIKKLYCSSSIEEEVTFVASEICKLIKSGIDINNIKLSNVNSSYYFNINKIFSLFNIPIELNSNNYIKGSRIVKSFKENYSNNLNETFDIISKLVKTKEDNNVFKQLINIVNEYSFTNDKLIVKELIFNDIDKIKTSNKKLKNSVKIVDIENEIISENDYIFLINYNEGVIPINYKDEDYLSDNIKNDLNISDSSDLNNKANLSIKNAIKRVKNLIVTYSNHDSGNEIYISSSYDEELFNKEEIKIDFTNSNKYNQIKLLSELDLNKKYGVVSEDLVNLNNHYKDYKYLSFDNSYKLINKNSLLDYLKKGLTLSYTSVNSYYECSFKYYLSSILRIDKFEDSFEMVIGNIFHHILSKCFSEKFDLDSSWDYEINNSKYKFNSMEKFFLNKLKNEMVIVIDTIKNQLNYTSLKKSMYEKEIIIKINEELNIIFKGFIDKIMYDEVDGQVIVVIIDYKTGNAILNLNNVKYGLSMQLPVYVYLAKNSEFKNVRIGGFYLQKILSNSKNIDDRIESLKLQGYSNSDSDILKYVDSSYENSKVIKSMRVGNNGFYSYSKTISDEQIDILNEIVSDNIKKSSDSIIDGHFDINPKEINGVNVSCTYCKYKDICYRKNEDIVKLHPVTLFGGDIDA